MYLMVMPILIIHSIVKNVFPSFSKWMTKVLLDQNTLDVHTHQSTNRGTLQSRFTCTHVHTRAHMCSGQGFAQLCDLVRFQLITHKKQKAQNHILSRLQNKHGPLEKRTQSAWKKYYSIHNVQHCNTVNEGNTPNEVHFLPKNKKLPSQK